MKVNHKLNICCQRTTPSVWVCKGGPSSALLTAVWCLGSWQPSQTRRQWICVWPLHRPECPTFRTFDPEKLPNLTNILTVRIYWKAIRVKPLSVNCRTSQAQSCSTNKRTSHKTCGKHDLTRTNYSQAFYVVLSPDGFAKIFGETWAYKPLTRNG